MTAARLASILLIGCWLLPLDTNASTDVEQWGIQQVTLHSKSHYDNPFAAVTLNCRFSSAGKEVRVAGFYDGEDTWKARLMPDSVGATGTAGPTAYAERARPRAVQQGPLHDPAARRQLRY